MVEGWIEEVCGWVGCLGLPCCCASRSAVFRFKSCQKNRDMLKHESSKDKGAKKKGEKRGVTFELKHW
jgi:hypothetical protein